VNRKWRDLSVRQRCAVIAAVVVQFALAGAAWWDLSRRPSADVRGEKLPWALVIAINFAGPLIYFRSGRKPVSTELEPPGD
jgi:hypothetical protein